MQSQEYKQVHRPTTRRCEDYDRQAAEAKLAEAQLQRALEVACGEIALDAETKKVLSLIDLALAS